MVDVKMQENQGITWKQLNVCNDNWLFSSSSEIEYFFWNLIILFCYPNPCTNHYRTFSVLGNFKFKWEFMLVNNDKLYSGNWNWNYAWNTSYQKHSQITSKAFPNNFKTYPNHIQNFQPYCCQDPCLKRTDWQWLASSPWGHF